MDKAFHFIDGLLKKRYQSYHLDTAAGGAGDDNNAAFFSSLLIL